MGQSFSTTKKGLELQSHQCKEISDVKSNKLCLTDGIGIIAPWLAHELSKELGIDESLGHPCAFQIRFSGYKGNILPMVLVEFISSFFLGMVCLDIADRITNSDVGLYLRPSMNKFDSQNRSIDVVRVSSMPSASFLSRQIILLLSSLGIADDVFHSMQNEMLCDLKTLTTDHQKARQFLHKFGGIGSNGYHAFLLDYLKIFRGHMEPFAHKLLIAFQGYLLKELRTKARILVLNTWTVLGVIDETRTLKYGQVFVQIHEKTESGGIKSKIITGPVIVTRNPCFHPGK